MSFPCVLIEWSLMSLQMHQHAKLENSTTKTRRHLNGWGLMGHDKCHPTRGCFPTIAYEHISLNLYII